MQAKRKAADSMDLYAVLSAHRSRFGLVLELDYRTLPCTVLDLTRCNPDARRLNPGHPEAFASYIASRMRDQQTAIALGRYAENRVIYDVTELHRDGGEPRTVHLGVDLWVPAGTPVYAPLDGCIHGFRNNRALGDYGPTVVFTHRLEAISFHILYGHLSRASLDGLVTGQPFRKGERFATVGMYPENGNWPPHLHVQVIFDMEGASGDYPGVCAVQRVAEFVAKCPDPNLILQIPVLAADFAHGNTALPLRIRR